MNEKSRKEFEAFARSQFMRTERWPDGNYHYRPAQFAWLTRQGARGERKL
ncbi:hypothetical protein ACMYUJ_03385 [Stutzerimonas zhaodongensis]